MNERKRKLRDVIKRDYLENDVTIPEAAKKYDVPESTLRRWRKQGAWDAKKIAANEEADRKVQADIVDKNVRTARIAKDAARVLLHVGWEVSAGRAIAIRNAHRANPKKTSRRMIEELNQIAALQLRLDDVSLAVLGDIEKSLRPTRSEFHLKIGDRISDTATRIEERHFDDQGCDVDSKGNLIH